MFGGGATVALLGLNQGSLFRTVLFAGSMFYFPDVVLFWLGLRFNFSLDWMWLSDPADLQERLLQTIYYFHAFPPGMDLFSGILLKIG